MLPRSAMPSVKSVTYCNVKVRTVDGWKAAHSRIHLAKTEL